MTKKQVVCSLRERIDYLRDVAERESCRSVDNHDVSYFIGRVDGFDLVLEMLSDYD